MFVDEGQYVAKEACVLLRKKFGIKSKDIAHKMGISPRAYGNVERYGDGFRKGRFLSCLGKCIKDKWIVRDMNGDVAFVASDRLIERSVLDALPKQTWHQIDLEEYTKEICKGFNGY